MRFAFKPVCLIDTPPLQQRTNVVFAAESVECPKAAFQVSEIILEDAAALLDLAGRKLGSSLHAFIECPAKRLPEAIASHFFGDSKHQRTSFATEGFFTVLVIRIPPDGAKASEPESDLHSRTGCLLGGCPSVGRWFVSMSSVSGIQWIAQATDDDDRNIRLGEELQTITSPTRGP